MDNEGYPEMSELILIEKWDCVDFSGLIDFIEERWAYAESGYFSKQWVKDKLFNNPELIVNMSTAGWSGNESIIDSLLKNMAFRLFWYYSWKRGGHYVFKINPFNVGYISVAEMAKKKGVSRQAIHQNKASYEWITIPKRSLLCRERSSLIPNH